MAGIQILKRIGETVFWSFVSGLVLLSVKWVSQNSGRSAWELTATALASVAFGALITTVRFHINESGSIMLEIRNANDDTKALLMLFQNLLTVSDFFRSLMAQGKADLDLAKVLMKRINEYVWRIPQAEPALAYQILSEALECASRWEGIHASSLGELGKAPLDEAGNRYFEVLRNRSMKSKKRIILLKHQEFLSYRSSEELDASKKKLVLDLWAATGQNVACYFFDADALTRVLTAQGFPEKRAKRLSRASWPDCAIYNDRYFVAYHRNGNEIEASKKSELVNHEGVVKIWTTDLEARDLSDPEDEEVMISLLAKGVRTLFDHLEDQEHKGLLSEEEGYFCKLDSTYIEKLQKTNKKRR